MRHLATLKITQNFNPRNRKCCFSIFRKIVFVALSCQSCKFSAETMPATFNVLKFSCCSSLALKRKAIFQRSSKALTLGDYKSRSRNFLSTFLASLSEKKNHNDNSSICCLFSDFVWEASLLFIPLVFALGVFLRWLSELLHSASAVSPPESSASFSETLDPKEESKKEELASENSEDDESCSSAILNN